MSYPLDDSLFDREGQRIVLRLLATRCEAMSVEAAMALRSTSAAGVQLRLDRIIPQALGDEAAGWTQDERALLESHIQPAV